MLWFQIVFWDYSSCLINFHHLEKLTCGLSGGSKGASVPLDRLGLLRGASCLMRSSCSPARCLWRLGSGTWPRRVPYRVWSGVFEGSLKGNALFYLWYSCCLVILGMPCSLFSSLLVLIAFQGIAPPKSSVFSTGSWLSLGPDLRFPFRFLRQSPD